MMTIDINKKCITASEYKFYVSFERTCPECEGEGWVTHPLWKKLHSDRKSIEGLDDVFDAIDWMSDWFGDKGYPLDDVPSEKTECFDCKGKGVSAGRIDLQEALVILSVE